MTTASACIPMSRHANATFGWLRLAVAGALIGLADLAFAAAYWAPTGVAPIRIPQSIAAWMLGTVPAVEGGWFTAVLGAAFYVALTTLMVAGYCTISQRHRLLLRRPRRCGALYGLAMYVLLFKIAVPSGLAWAGRSVPPDPLAWTIACSLAYMTLIGIPCALFARAWTARNPER